MDPNNPLILSQTREVFLQRATSVEDWNARAVFVELLHIPTNKDIEAYCRVHFAESWKLRAKSGGFYWRCEGMSLF